MVIRILVLPPLSTDFDSGTGMRSGALVTLAISIFGDIGWVEMPRTIPIWALPGALGEKRPPYPLLIGVIPLESNPPKPALPLLSSPCPENTPADALIKLSYYDDPEPLSLGVKIPRFI